MIQGHPFLITPDRLIAAAALAFLSSAAAVFLVERHGAAYHELAGHRVSSAQPSTPTTRARALPGEARSCSLPAAPTPPCGSLDNTIRQVSPHHFLLRRSGFACLLGETSRLASPARIVPALRDGRPVGIKLFAIRPDSLFGRLGLRSGDTLRAINGQELSSPDRCLEAYTRVRQVDSLRLQIDRQLPAGVTLSTSLSYQIVDRLSQ